MAKKTFRLTADSVRDVLEHSEGIDKTTAETLLESLAEASKSATPWWVIALKTVAYLIGLLLAGYGTSAAAQTLLIECVNA